MAYLDFCGHLRGENLEALELLFSRNLLESLSILAITVSYRRNRGQHGYYMQLIDEAENEVGNCAQRHGYQLGTKLMIRNAPFGMVTFVWKVMRPATALHYQYGFLERKDGYGVSDWLREPFN